MKSTFGHTFLLKYTFCKLHW